MELLRGLLPASSPDLSSLSPVNSKLATAVGVGAVAATVLIVARRMRGNRGLPPGPSGLPIVGCVQLGDQMMWHRTLTETGAKYDGIYSFYYGSKLMIVVTRYELLREMLDNQVFAGRIQTPLTERIVQNCGILLAEGASWSHHRRMSLRILRDFGFARAETVEMVDVAMEAVVASLDAACETKEPRQLLNLCMRVSNGVIAQLLFGRRFDKDKDEKFANFCQVVVQLLNSPFLTLMDKYPILYSIVMRMPAPKGRVELITTMLSFVRGVIAEREAAMADQNAEPVCLCDVYIMERRKAEKKGDFETYRENHLLRICFEFFLAGTDTTARSVEWMLLYMAFYPNVQDRVHRELDDVVGRARLPRMSDKPQLHYLNAVTDESYRKASLVAIGVFHRATEDTTFRGYRIPKEALIVPHVYAVHHDAHFWTQPEQFRPERFLDNVGHYKASNHVVPFLIGKRSCVGESLGRMEIFLMFTRLMQRYRVRPSEESLRRKDEILGASFGAVMTPGKYGLVFSKR